MKKLIILSFILLTLAGCGKKIDISQKQVRNGLVYTVNEEIPYTGKVIGKYSDGKDKLIEHFKDGKFNGEQLYYYDNGQVKEKITYNLGEVVGTYYSYHKNGELNYTGAFTDGKKNGEWNRYDENKDLILTEIYKNGKLKDVKQYIVDTDKLKEKLNKLFD